MRTLFEVPTLKTESNITKKLGECKFKKLECI